MYLSFKAIFKSIILLWVCSFISCLSPGGKDCQSSDIHPSLPRTPSFQQSTELPLKKTCILQLPLQLANGMCAEVMVVHSEFPCEGKGRASFLVPFPSPCWLEGW